MKSKSKNLVATRKLLPSCTASTNRSLSLHLLTLARRYLPPMEKNHTASTTSGGASSFDMAAAAALLDDMIKKLFQTYAHPDARPVDELECYNNDGTLDMDRFGEYLEQEDNEESAEQNVLLTSLLWNLCAVHQQREAQKRCPSTNESRGRTKRGGVKNPSFLKTQQQVVCKLYRQMFLP